MNLLTTPGTIVKIEFKQIRSPDYQPVAFKWTDYFWHTEFNFEGNLPDTRASVIDYVTNLLDNVEVVPYANFGGDDFMESVEVMVQDIKKLLHHFQDAKITEYNLPWNCRVGRLHLSVTIKPFDVNLKQKNLRYILF